MNYVSITAQVKESILSDVAPSLSYSFVAATRERNMQTSQRLKS